MQEYFRISYSVQPREERKCTPDMFSFEDQVGLDILENLQKEWPTRDHQITHAGLPIPQIPTATDQVLDQMTLEQLVEHVNRPAAGHQAMYYI